MESNSKKFLSWMKNIFKGPVDQQNLNFGITNNTIPKTIEPGAITNQVNVNKRPFLSYHQQKHQNYCQQQQSLKHQPINGGPAKKLINNQLVTAKIEQINSDKSALNRHFKQFPGKQPSYQNRHPQRVSPAVNLHQSNCNSTSSSPRISDESEYKSRKSSPNYVNKKINLTTLDPWLDVRTKDRNRKRARRCRHCGYSRNGKSSSQDSDYSNEMNVLPHSVDYDSHPHQLTRRFREPTSKFNPIKTKSRFMSLIDSDCESCFFSLKKGDAAHYNTPTPETCTSTDTEDDVSRFFEKTLIVAIRHDSKNNCYFINKGSLN